MFQQMSRRKTTNSTSTTTMILLLYYMLVGLACTNNNNEKRNLGVVEAAPVDRRPGSHDKQQQSTPSTSSSSTTATEGGGLFGGSGAGGGLSTRIIGGDTAQVGRYPYMVSLLNEDQEHTCGGSLVAADVVITAAHCRDVLKYAQVGRYNRGDAADNYDELEIVGPEYIHPLYEDEKFPYDFMLLKLESISGKQPIALNDDNKLPERITGENDELTVIGFGITVAGDADTESNILQVANVNYVDNDTCEKSKHHSIADDYSGLISSDMLCAMEYGQDACQGDSGGPLILARGYAQRDMLVGIVSWGYGCAMPTFPGVYSRISDQIDWIQSTICQVSSKPPPEIDCSQVSSPGGIARAVPVTIILQFDDYPAETGWSIKNKESDTKLVEVPAGTYEVAQALTPETVFLPVGETYIFEIQDTFGDGLCCTTSGNYIVILGRNPDGEVLVAGGGDFGLRSEHEFYVPEDYQEPSESDSGPIIGEGQIPLTIVIQLDSYPQEVGWRVDRLGLEAEEVIRIPAGIYVTPDAKVIRTIVLEEGELYYFRIYDIMEDGIRGGSVELFLGAMDSEGESRMILQEDGDFGGGVDVSFVASFAAEPTLAPQIDGTNFLSLELRFDQYPEEIAVQLRTTDSETSIQRDDSGIVLFFRPPRYYVDYVEQTVIETIPIPDDIGREYTFIITDSYGDGLCCNWAGESDTGYTLYRGDPSDMDVIITSKFETSSREVSVFTVDGPIGGTISPNPDEGKLEVLEPLPTAEIVVRITLDVFPDETGFYILDEWGHKVVDYPPSTFREPSEIIEEVISVEIGLYTFAIVDVFGDGLNMDDAQYSISLNNEPSRPPLIVGNGKFTSEERQTFIVDGETATYPLNVRFTTDSDPKEIGFYVERIDIPLYDARVVTVVHGTYQSSNEEIRESILLREGGLYRIVFEDLGQNGIGGLIRVSHGVGSSASTFSLDGNTFHELRVKVLAGALPSTPAIAKTLSFRVKFDRFPHEIEWILLWNDRDAVNTYGNTPSLRNPGVVAFGPPSLYPQTLANTEWVETILLPSWVGEKSFTMIVTDSAGDGVCCNFGSGGPVELFDGMVEDGVLLFSDPLEENGRFTDSFTLIGDGKVSSSAARCTSWVPRQQFSICLAISLLLFAGI